MNTSLKLIICFSIRLLVERRFAGQLFAKALVFLVVTCEHVAPGKLATLHAGITGQVIDLGAFAFDFVWAAPG